MGNLDKERMSLIVTERERIREREREREGERERVFVYQGDEATLFTGLNGHLERLSDVSSTHSKRFEW